MAGTLTIDTLKASSGVLATQNGMTGIAKAWVYFNGNSGSVAINGSFNVSSLTRNATGDYTITFTTAMPNTNYCTLGACGNTGTYSGMPVNIYSTSSGGNLVSAPTTTSTRFTVSQPNVGYVDSPSVCVSVFSS